MEMNDKTILRIKVPAHLYESVKAQLTLNEAAPINMVTTMDGKTVVGTMQYGVGFKANEKGKQMGFKDDPKSIPNGTKIQKDDNKGLKEAKGKSNYGAGMTPVKTKDSSSGGDKPKAKSSSAPKAKSSKEEKPKATKAKADKAEPEEKDDVPHDGMKKAKEKKGHSLEELKKAHEMLEKRIAEMEKPKEEARDWTQYTTGDFDDPKPTKEGFRNALDDLLKKMDPLEKEVKSLEQELKSLKDKKASEEEIGEKQKEIEKKQKDFDYIKAKFDATFDVYHKMLFGK